MRGGCLLVRRQNAIAIDKQLLGWLGMYKVKWAGLRGERLPSSPLTHRMWSLFGLFSLARINVTTHNTPSPSFARVSPYSFNPVGVYRCIEEGRTPVGFYSLKILLLVKLITFLN